MDRRPSFEEEDEASAKRLRMDETPPSEDIQELFGDMLEWCPDYPAHVSFSWTWNEPIPNCGLVVDVEGDEGGVLGLPVTVREASRLVAGEERGVVRLDATFRNPEWQQWVDSTAVQVARDSLGSHQDIYTGLQTLLVQVSERTAPSLPQQLTPAPKGEFEADLVSFAFLVLAVPSEGTGGSLEITGAGETISYPLRQDGEGGIMLGTTAVGWYHQYASSVLHPPHDGCQALLVYELFVRQEALALSPVDLPSPQVWLDAVSEAQALLRRWRESLAVVDGGPDRLCHFIPGGTAESVHTSASMKAGPRARTVTNRPEWALLQEAAEKEGLRAGLVPIKVTIEGSADDSGCYEEREPPSRHKYYHDWDTPLQCRCGHHEFRHDDDEDEEYFTTTWSVVGSNISTGGSLSCDYLPFHKREMCPAPDFDFDEPDHEKYESRGDTAGELAYSYYGTVLLVEQDESVSQQAVSSRVST